MQRTSSSKSRLPRRSLREIDAYKAPPFVAARVAKTHDLSLSCARALVREAKRMLYLRVVSGEPVTPSSLVDLAWHEMMVFTRWYQEYADFIGHFVHHDPTPPSSIRAYLRGTPNKKRVIEEGRAAYGATKLNYKKYFGIQPDPRYWP